MRLFFWGLFIFLFCVNNNFAAAFMWPIFTLPDQKFLSEHQNIDTSNCPPGEARLRSQPVITFQSICNTYCPANWHLTIKSDEKCHSLMTGFAYLGVDIIHHKNQDGDTLFSEVRAHYGEKQSGLHYFDIEFVSPKENWYCMEFNSELRAITCANDL